MTDQEKLDILLRHIGNVQDRTQLLGTRLIAQGEVEFGRMLIANGLKHDQSKFFGIEWKYLHQDVKDSQPELFAQAAEQHVTTNRHHPEAWGGIEHMPEIFISEMCCDWAARSSEFGNDLRDWIKDSATKKFGFTVQSKTYKTIKKYVDLLLDPAFK